MKYLEPTHHFSLPFPLFQHWHPPLAFIPKAVCATHTRIRTFLGRLLCVAVVTGNSDIISCRSNFLLTLLEEHFQFSDGAAAKVRNDAGGLSETGKDYGNIDSGDST
jgi:hypothetical protein